jgi:hypothetical protein
MHRGSQAKRPLASVANTDVRKCVNTRGYRTEIKGCGATTVTKRSWHCCQRLQTCVAATRVSGSSSHSMRDSTSSGMSSQSGANTFPSLLDIIRGNARLSLRSSDFVKTQCDNRLFCRAYNDAAPADPIISGRTRRTTTFHGQSRICATRCDSREVAAAAQGPTGKLQ